MREDELSTEDEELIEDGQWVDDPFEKVVNYYLIDEQGLKSTNTTKLVAVVREFLLHFFSIIGSLGYLKPAKEFANGNPTLQVLFPIGTVVPAYAVLVITTENLLQSIKDQIHPKQFNQYIEDLNRAKLAIKYFGVTAGASFTALPFYLTADEYRIANNDVVVHLFNPVFLIVNIVLHLTPIEYIINDKNVIIRAPLLPLITSYHAYQWIQQKRMSHTAQKALQFENKRHKNCLILKQEMCKTITQAQELLIKNGYRFDPSKVAYDMITDLKSEKSAINFKKRESAVSQLISFIEYTNQYKKAIPYNKWFNWINFGAENIVYLLGGTIALITFIGYSADPFKELPTVKPFNSAPDVLAEIVSGIADYVFNTLFFSLTANAAVRGYRYMKSFFIEDNTSKLPLAFKLYPKTFSVFLLLNTVIAPFSGAAAAQLIKDNFAEEEWDPYRPFLIECALSGMAYLAWAVLYDTENFLFTMFARVFGKTDEKAVLRVMKKLDQVKNAILALQDNIIVRALENRPNKRSVLLNDMTDERYRELTFFIRGNEAQKLINLAPEDKETIAITNIEHGV